ncbi:MAG: glycosyltransferase [Planctomycetota bacterium]
MISFIIPAHDEERLLAATLQSIKAAADTVGEPFEVIVVDDASTDGTAEVAREQGATVLSVEHRQISRTRNAGATVSNGEWLVFVDADTQIGPDVLGGAVAALRGGAVGGGARLEFEGTAPLVPRVLAAIFLPIYFGLRLAAGCFVFCTREAFDEAGGFDPELYASEEVTFSNELKKRGRFVILRNRVVTSGRKLRSHSVREMIAPLGAMMLRGRKTFDRREGLDLWYGARRND